MPRIVTIAGAQLGPVQKADSRESVVARMIALMDQATAQGADFIVYPELALTTFFPRCYYEDPPEAAISIARYLSTKAARSLANTGRCICPATPNSTRSAPSSTSRSDISSR